MSFIWFDLLNAFNSLISELFPLNALPMASPLAKSWIWGQGQNSEIQHSAVICVLTDALVSALSPAALRLLLPGQQWYKGHGDGHHGAGQPSGDDPAAADALGGEIQGESLNSYHTFHLVSVWSSREERLISAYSCEQIESVIFLTWLW